MFIKINNTFKNSQSQSFFNFAIIKSIFNKKSNDNTRKINIKKLRIQIAENVIKRLISQKNHRIISSIRKKMMILTKKIKIMILNLRFVISL